MATLAMASLGSSPILLAALIGIVAALALWHRAPRSALLVLIACIVQLAAISVGLWIQGWWFPLAREAGGASIAHLAFLVGIWGVCSTALHAVALGLLVWAAFTGRPQARTQPPPIG